MSLFRKWLSRRKDEAGGENDVEADGAVVGRRRIRPEEGPSGPRARPHHYLFAHRALPAVVFQRPDRFVDLMRSSEAEEILSGLWQQVGERVDAAERRSRLRPDGLTVSLHLFGGEAYPIITLPPAERTVEGIYVAVGASRDAPEEYRYFILERSETSRPDQLIGVLCEWFADGSRRNYEWAMPGDLETFRRAIVEVFAREAAQRDAGLTTTTGMNWNPTIGEAPKSDLEEQGHYRPQICVFAYEVIPDKVRLSVEEWVSAIEAGQMQPILRELWQEADEICRGAGLPALAMPAGMRADLVMRNGERFILLTMPEPVATPEPFFLLIPEDPTRSGGRLFTLEMPTIRYDHSALFCWIELGNEGGTHSIAGQIPDATQESFLLAVGGAQPEIHPGDILKHLLTYTQIHQIVSPDTPAPQIDA